MSLDTIPAPLRKFHSPRHWYERAAVPVNLRNSDFGVLEFDDPEPVELAQELVEAWQTEGNYQGLALFGKPGRGKTLIASTMLCSYIRGWVEGRSTKKLVDASPPAYFITLAEYQRLHLRVIEVDKMMQRSPDDSAGLMQEWVDNYGLRRWINEDVPHLVLDDVGKEHTTASGFVEANFDALVRGRWARGLSTTITSNLSQKAFLENYGEAMTSFLREMCVVVPVKGQDRR